MRFTYQGPDDQVTIFGLLFIKGEAVEVTDPHALGKLAGMQREFSHETSAPAFDAMTDAPELAAPKRRGRMTLAKPDADQG